MNNSSTKGIFFLAALLLLFFWMSFYLLSFLHHQRENNYLQQMTEQHRVQLQSIIYSLEKTADIVFETLFENNATAEILSLAGQAGDEKKDALRQLLLDRFSSNYGKLQEYGIDFLHFHLPGSISYLRFQSPAVYGDTLQGVRHSIDLVNKNRSPVHGFEEGRVSQGFRNVYPLYYWDEFVGTMEISFSFAVVRELAAQLFPAIHTLILHEDVIASSVPEQGQKRYMACRVSPLYREDRRVVERIQQELPNLGIISLEELRTVNDELRYVVAERLANGEAFSLARSFNQEKQILRISFLPASNIKGKDVGYFISYSEDQTLKSYNQRYHQMQLVIFFIALSSLTTLFFYIRQSRRRKKYQALATVDGLTGLANRFHFDLILGQAIRQGNRNNSLFSLILFDIDDFKKVNDNYGHDGGDKTLVHFSSLIRNSVREQDLVARWGGEEFVVLLPETELTAASVVAEKLRRAVEGSRVQSGRDEIKVTCSFGVTQFRKEMEGDELFRKVDQALYQAKESGKNCVMTAD